MGILLRPGNFSDLPAFPSILPQLTTEQTPHQNPPCSTLCLGPPTSVREVLGASAMTIKPDTGSCELGFSCFSVLKDLQQYEVPLSTVLPGQNPPMPHQVVLGLGHIGVLWPPQGLIDAQGPRVVPLHILELALVLAEQGQVVELLGHIRVVGTEDLGCTQTLSVT